MERLNAPAFVSYCFLTDVAESALSDEVYGNILSIGRARAQHGWGDQPTLRRSSGNGSRGCGAGCIIMSRNSGPAPYDS